MQKKIIALAVAGLMSGAAFAQSNVTISGRVDIGYHHSSASGLGGAADTTSGIQSGVHDGSRIAFAGEENLGNGLKAIFMLEYGLSNDTNAGVGAASFGSSTSSRQQWLGLTGGFGTVVAGQVYTPSDDMGAYDSMDQTAFSPRAIMGWGTAHQSGTRWENSVKYTSPTMGGFTVSAIYGFAPIPTAGQPLSTANTDTTAYNGSTDNTRNQERGFGLGANYTNGPLSVGLYHDRINNINNATSDKVGATRLGASYDFGVVAAYGTYEKGFIRGSTTPGLVSTGIAGDKDKAKMWSVGLTAPLGNGLLRTMYARLNVNDAASTPSDSITGWGIGYDYNMSKRTMLYTGYTRVNGESNNSTSFAGPAPANGGTYTGYGFGMLHKF